MTMESVKEKRKALAKKLYDEYYSGYEPVEEISAKKKRRRRKKNADK